jgi:hypothetical protein
MKQSDHASRRTVTNIHTDLSRATFDFCPVLAELLQSRRAVERTGRVYEGLAALSTINNLHTIHQLMLESRALRTLEVGLGCELCRVYPAPSIRNLTILRPFSTPRSFLSSFELLRSYGCRTGPLGTQS